MMPLLAGGLRSREIQGSALALVNMSCAEAIAG